MRKEVKGGKSMWGQPLEVTLIKTKHDLMGGKWLRQKARGGSLEGQTLQNRKTKKGPKGEGRVVVDGRGLREEGVGGGGAGGPVRGWGAGMWGLPSPVAKVRRGGETKTHVVNN